MRRRLLAENRVPCDHSVAAITAGDLLWMDASDGNVKPASAFPWQGDLSSTRRAFASVCFGVASESTRPGLALITVDSSGAEYGHQFSCPAGNYGPASGFGPQKHATNSQLLSQAMEAVEEPSEACARVARYDATAGANEVVYLVVSNLMVGSSPAQSDALFNPPAFDFQTGWMSFNWSRLQDVLTVGTAHAACSLGPETPTVHGVAFERSSSNGGDTSVPGSGWSGTNWVVQRASSAGSPLVVPASGNNTGRTETTAFGDFPDPSFGDNAALPLLTKSSMRRNALLGFDNLTPGNRYYAIFLFGTYPASGTRFTKLTPDLDAADSLSFSIDDTGLLNGVKRYGFTAPAGGSIRFLKQGPDSSSSYINAFLCTDQGAA